MTLAGRRILITGAASGIGRATVERFATEGARVAALDRDDADLPIYLRADVSDAAAVGAAVAQAADALGGLDGVVNAAGIDLVADIESMTLEDWHRIIAVNLTGPMLVSRAAFPHLRTAGGGTIVNVSSGAGLLPLMHRTAYCSSKAGLQMLGKALAMEAGAHGIRVNTVCPGAVETPLFRSGIGNEAAYEAVRTRYVLRRVAEPAEIVGAILWLTGPDSSYVTGTAVAVDGGRTFH